MDETTAPPNERAAHTQGSLGDGRMQFCLTIKRVTGAGSGQNIGKPMDETDNDHGDDPPCNMVGMALFPYAM